MTVHHLPAPPNDQELYWYFGPQRRSVLLCTSLAFVLTAATMFTFALRTPALADPAIGIVQSPQCFDTDASMSWIERAAGSAQEWFFRWIQPSRDASDAAICCGSNAVYRRTAIEAAGGFAKLDHSEDMYTGLALYEQGFRTLYVPVLVAKGTSPDSLASFVNQQYRWAMGNLHLLTGRDLKRMGAPWRMRLCFYEGIVGYLTMAVNIFAAPLPPLVMMYGYPDQIRPWHVLPLLAPLWLWHVLLPRVSRTRWRVEVLRANVLMSIASGAAFLHTLRGRSAAWVPTGAGKARPGGLARRVVLVALAWTAGSILAAAGGLALDVAGQGWGPNWGMLLYLLVQAQIGLPLVRDLLAELRSTAPARRPTDRAGMLPRRWPEGLAITTGLTLTALLASGWVSPMLPWLG